LTATLNSRYVEAVFPYLSDLCHRTEEKYHLRHPVANPQKFALRFDDIVKIYYIQSHIEKCISPRHL